MHQPQEISEQVGAAALAVRDAIIEQRYQQHLAATPPPAPDYKLPQLNRAQRRAVKHGPALPGNNRKATAGRKLIQQHRLAFLTVGEEPRLIEVATFVRGKGGKRKVVIKKLLLSRQLIATGQIDLRSLVGVVEDDPENDSIKTGAIRVLVPAQGRVLNKTAKN